MVRLKKSTIALIFTNLVLIILLMIAQCTKIQKKDRDAYIIKLAPKTLIDRSERIILRAPKRLPYLLELAIVKKNGIYMLEKGKYSYYPKEGVINRFFSALDQKIRSYSIGGSPYDYSFYGLDDDNAFNIRFVSSTGEILLDLYLGSSNATDQMRYIRRGGSSTAISSTEDVASSFLNVESSFWIDMQPLKGKLYKAKITSLSLQEETVLREKDSDEKFIGVEKALSSLTMIDTFDSLALEGERTESFSFTLDVGGKFSIYMSPLDNGDYVFFDNIKSQPYILSAYSKKRLVKAIMKVLE